MSLFSAVKHIPALACVVLLSAGSLGSASHAQNNDTMTVTASGEGSGGTNMTLDQVKQLALTDAKRMALEQAGTAIRSETEVKNFELIKDEIQSFAEGLVKVKKIISNTCAYEDKVKSFMCKATIEAEVEVSQGKELFTRLHQSVKTEQKNQSKAPLSFGFNILAWKESATGTRGVRIKSDSSQSYQQTPLQEGGVMYSGQEYQIHLTPAQDCYLYGINVDSHGQVFPLIPNPEGMSDNYLRANQTYVLPAPGKYYQLDNNTGLEKIYLLASYDPMQDVDYLIQQSQSQNAAVLLDSAVRTRGISGITQGNKKNYQVAQGVSVQEAEKVVRGKGHSVQIFKIQHK